MKQSTDLTVVGDVWIVVNEYETGIPVNNYFTVMAIDDENECYDDEGYQIGDDFIRQGWLKRIK